MKQVIILLIALIISVGCRQEETEKSQKVVDEASSHITQYENREWVISHKGKAFRVRACFVKSDFGKVYIKSEASGKVKAFPRSVFSDADRKYLKSIGK